MSVQTPRWDRMCKKMYWGKPWGEGEQEGAGTACRPQRRSDPCERRAGREVWGQKAAVWSGDNVRQAGGSPQAEAECWRGSVSFSNGPAPISPACLGIGWEQLGWGQV